jgi:hypothetical protein
VSSVSLHRWRCGYLNFLLLAMGIDAFGQDRRPSPNLSKNSRELGIGGYGRKDESCLEWSDSCVTCSRNQRGGECSYSNIGCQPEIVQCLRRDEEAGSQIALKRSHIEQKPMTERVN